MGQHLPLEKAVLEPEIDSVACLSDYVQPLLRQPDEVTVQSLTRLELPLEQLQAGVREKLVYDADGLRRPEEMFLHHSTNTVSTNGSTKHDRLLSKSFDEP